MVEITLFELTYKATDGGSELFYPIVPDILLIQMFYSPSTSSPSWNQKGNM